MNRYEVEFSPRALSSLREATHYILQDSRVVTVIDVVHAAHGTERDRYEPPRVREREPGKRRMVSV